LFRAITFKEMAYIPIETREDPDVLGKQWAVIRGLYAAGVDFIYTAMGVFQPRHLGVGQFYGAAAEAHTEKKAIAEVTKQLLAVEATMANFPHLKLKSPAPERIGLLLSRIERLPRIIAVLGHPDPRLARKGMGRDGSLGDVDDEMLAQQGENMLRGLAKIRRDFVFTVTASHIARQNLADALVKMSRWSSQYASRQRGALGASFSIAIPLAAALGSSANASHGSGQTHAVSHNDGVAQSRGVSEAHSWGHGVSHGETRGEADTSSLAVTNGSVVSHGGGVTHSNAHTASWAHTHSQTDTASHGNSVAHSAGSSWSAAHTTGVAHGTSVSHGTSHSVTDATGSSWSSGRSAGQSASHALSSHWGANAGVSASVGQTAGTTQSATASASTGSSMNSGIQSSDSAGSSSANNWRVGGSVSAGLLGTGVTGNASYGGGSGVNQSHSLGGSTTFGSSNATGTAISNGTSAQHSASMGTSHGSSVGGGASAGTAVSSGTSSSAGGSASHAVSNGSFSSVSRSAVHSASTTHARGGFTAATKGESWGTAHSTGSADSRGGARSTGLARSSSWGAARSHSVTAGRSHTISRSESVGESWSEGRTTGRSQSWGRSHSDGQSQALSIARSGSRGYVGGLGAGIVPGIAITRSWQSEDDVAIRLTEISRQLVSLLNLASLEGGFYTTATLAVDEAGLKPAMATVTQSFHGKDVPTPIQPVQGDDVLRPFMLAFRPSLQPSGDPFGVGLWTKWGTLHTVQMLAALTAPNLFEEGAAMTVQEKMPAGVAFYPLMEGEVTLGHQVSPETYDLTTTPLRLSRKRHFHTAFVGDTGFGKTVAAERLAYETTLHWKMRTIVLDFGRGWRKMLKAPGLEGRVEVRQLNPKGVRPLRWNPLQIGRRIDPEDQWRAFTDLFTAIGRMGKKMQVHELRNTLQAVYLNAGVLVDDPELPPAWRVVRPGEEALLGVPLGTPLHALAPDQMQRLAVTRSKRVDLRTLYDEVEKRADLYPPRDIRNGIYNSMKSKLSPLITGKIARMFAAGPDAIDINELTPGDWGVAVLEGGNLKDEFAKTFLLAWSAWQIYTEAVELRENEIETQPAHIQIIFEEANKFLTGVDGGGEDDAGPILAQQFETMWRDSRKYGIYLHIITQTPSAIPEAIMSSCSNLFVTDLKNRKDQDVMLAMLHKSPVGFTDEGWRRFLANIPGAMSIVKLGYAFDRALMEPMYIRPRMLSVKEPTDMEIRAKLGAISL
jgi:hypothetical protein